VNSDGEEELIKMSELRAMLGVGRTRAYNISRYKGFPEPVKTWDRFRTWRRRDVVAWLDENRPDWRSQKDPKSGGRGGQEDAP
jgi:predicted DNA-binding transcriptional regulator AlpA